MAKPLCGCCELRPVEATGRCHTCRNYLLRTGYDRTPELVEAELKRMAAKSVVR
jgi:hypothetical protein